MTAQKSSDSFLELCCGSQSGSQSGVVGKARQERESTENRVTSACACEPLPGVSFTGHHLFCISGLSITLIQFESVWGLVELLSFLCASVSLFLKWD